MEYDSGTCQQLLLGYTSGYRVPTIHESIAAGKGFQFYVLVLDKDGQWRRHDLGSAKGRRHAERTLGKLQSYLRCETVSRQIGRAECYELCQEENK